MSLFKELKRRNVLRIAVAYLAGAWILIQASDIIFPRLGISDIVVTNIIVALAIGFFPAVILAWFFELTPAGIKRDSDVVAGAPSEPRVSKTLDRIIIILLILALGFFAVDKFIFDPARDEVRVEAAEQKGRTEAVLESFGDKSIAVLAFDDMSPGQDQEYFSDGIAEELLNVLATIKELRVISRSTAFSFKGSNATLQEIGQKLNVGYILEGSVRKSGNQIRITAQLIDARTDAHVWSQTYDRQLDDVFAIQDEISASIVEQLKITLLSDLPTITRIDPIAYEKYLKSRYIVHTEDLVRIREAQRLLNEILAVEPDYIPALNELARTYYRIPKSEGTTRDQNTADIHALADRVIAIDPDGIHSFIWQGWLAYVDNDFHLAAQFYEQAIAIDPANVDLLRVVGLFLGRIGQPEEAIKLGEFLKLRDPSCITCIDNLAHVYALAGNYEQSALTLEGLQSWHPPKEGDFWSVGVSWLLAGERDKARAAFEQEQISDLKEAGAILILNELGHHAEFEQRFSSFRDDSQNTRAITSIYTWVGDADQAFKWIGQIESRFARSQIRWMRDMGIAQKFESDPRWTELLQKHEIDNTTTEQIDFHFSPSTDRL